MFTPWTTIAALQTSVLVSVDGDTRIILGQEPIPLPQLFRSHMVHRHLATRPNLRTAGGVASTDHETGLIAPPYAS
jgi:hypothetical protein